MLAQHAVGAENLRVEWSDVCLLVHRTSGRNVTFAQTPSGMMSVGPGSRDLFSSPMHDSASTARKKDMFRQRRVCVCVCVFLVACRRSVSASQMHPQMDKSHGSGRDEVGMGGTGVLGSATKHVEHDLGTIRSEYDLLYPQPVQAIRGAGSGPGLVGGHRNTQTAHVSTYSTFLFLSMHFCLRFSLTAICFPCPPQYNLTLTHHRLLLSSRWTISTRHTQEQEVSG